MNIENLRIFCRVIEEGNISKISRLEYISQPAVTKQIRQIENYYNTLFLNRERGILTPTEAGQALYPFARKIVDIFQQSQTAVNETIGKKEVLLNIGASYTIGDYLLPEAMGKFTKKFPQYLFSLTTGNTPQILESLKKQEIDIALVESDFNDEMLKKEVFAKDKLILTVSTDHRWKDRDFINSSELIQEKMIWREPESGTRVIIENALKEANVFKEISSTMELGSIESIKKAVEANLGISLLSTLAVKLELKCETLQEIPIKNINLVRDLFIVREPKRFSKQVVNDFVEFMQKETK